MLHQFSLIERALLKFDVIPHPFVDAASSVGLGYALAAAVKLGIVDHVGSAPRAAEDIALAAGTSAVGTRLALDCLDALGYVTQSAAGYAFSKRGLKHLAKDAPESFRYFILFCDYLYKGYGQLDETIRLGKRRQGSMLDEMDEAGWELFSRAMIEISRTNLKEVAGLVAVPSGAKSILDVGGSHGQYSMELCRRHPNASATVLDLPPVRRYADECIKRDGMTARVAFVEGNFELDDLPGTHDVILAFNIVHGLDEAGCQSLFAKAFRALRPGGTLAVLDQIKGTGGSTQLAKATTSYMALNLLHQAGGRTYTAAELGEFARVAGFTASRLRKLNSPGFGVVNCSK
ncbi:MAG: methyltransferase domain-containing protein [Myxococcales bacterium]|nr:methyltransferase domain-containing protein [Myxococcales bacterium]